MIKIIAVLCGLSSPANCHEQTVTTSDFADVSMQSCLMGAPQLAEWMKLHPAERPAGWRYVISLTCGGRKNCSSGAAAREVLPVSSESSPRYSSPHVENEALWLRHKLPVGCQSAFKTLAAFAMRPTLVRIARI
ncbi:hypothetical protein ABIB73_007279 [Bradyrhizobium sp. F1.4.3]